MVYKWCVVPQCTNTSIKTPEKMFVSIPKNTKIRKKWLMLARRNPKDIAASTNAFMCEDHFNVSKQFYSHVISVGYILLRDITLTILLLQIEQDMANYRQYTMGFSQTIIASILGRFPLSPLTKLVSIVLIYN
ncbi:hypothetical protein ILUMI_02205 [Ignelater luminosus]|uniref:THAP-type domain-containing protein n=1 Tax=Ignelater luminosus TaxID=2038154 RepID=A0A8K0DP77_IGNLU|nr:hypothetical protein ILUMI_02205 [Ignelater luminosus]